MMDSSRVRVSGPLERYASGFLADLADLVGVGYKRASAAFQLRLMGHLSRWLEEAGLTPEGLSSAEAARFLAARRAAGCTNHTTAKGLEPLLAYLRGLGVVPPADQPVLSAVELLLERYREYLLVERGLVAGTARGYVDLVRPFVVSRCEESGVPDFAGLAERGAQLRAVGVRTATA